MNISMNFIQHLHSISTKKTKIIIDTVILGFKKCTELFASFIFILNQIKLIYYEQFLVHFEWLLSLFQISDVK